MVLKGKRVALLVEDLYEDLELWYPALRLREEGAEVTVIGSGAKDTFASKHGYPAEADASASQVSANDFDAVVIPGGYAPDRMRRHEAMVSLVRDAFQQGKVVAAICHAGWVPASAGILRGKRMTSFVAIKDDMVNAGALWEDSEVVVDGNLITSRTPDDLPAFCKAIIEALSSSQ
jgi:protease I